MADSKITQLTATTAPVDADLVEIVQDVATTPTSKKITYGNLRPNASETVAGKVEEATDAEVTAGTATGATGAKLVVTPAKLATRLATVVVNASTTVKGIAEEATQTEVNAGTATGGTGAKLFVTPETLISWHNTPLATVTLSSPASTVSTGTFTAKEVLRVIVFSPGIATGAADIGMSFNDDSGNNYGYTISKNGGATSDGDSQTGFIIGNNIGADGGILSNCTIFNSSSFFKAVQISAVSFNSSGSASTNGIQEAAGMWASNNQVTKITISNGGGYNFATGTKIVVYG